MRALAGVDRYMADTVTYKGIPVYKKRAVRSISYLPQKFCGFPDMSVHEMLMYFAVLKDIPREKRESAACAAENALGIDQFRNKKVKKLSGGMLQRLGIAQCIMGHNEVLLLDEPTAGLDIEEKARFDEIIRSVSDSIVLISSHDASDLEKLCGRIIIINDGDIRFDGSIDHIRQIGKEHFGKETLEAGYLWIVREL